MNEEILFWKILQLVFTVLMVIAAYKTGYHTALRDEKKKNDCRIDTYGSLYPKPVIDGTEEIPHELQWTRDGSDFYYSMSSQKIKSVRIIGVNIEHFHLTKGDTIEIHYNTINGVTPLPTKYVIE